MSDLMCRYSGDREQAIVAYVYGDIDADERAQFDAHLPTCARCRTELSALSGVRAQLVRWAPPEPVGLTMGRQGQAGGSLAAGAIDPLPASHQPPAASYQLPATSHQPPATRWWRTMPVWAQAAAALLFLGVSAGVANLDVHHDANGLHVRTGWSKPAEAAPPSSAATTAASAPATRAELTAFEQQLQREIDQVKNSTNTANAANLANLGNPANPANADVLRRARALVDESERRQQRELALRVAEVLRDVSAQRQADLVQIQRSLGVIQSNTGVEMMRQRETINNILVRTSLQK